VLTHNCNLTEIAKHQAGWLVEPTVDDVFVGLREAYSSAGERQRRGENARTLIEQLYTWPRIATESIRFYRSNRLANN
jgi:glycosyltransferase involved in cell wall biosynthesis